MTKRGRRRRTRKGVGGRRRMIIARNFLRVGRIPVRQRCRSRQSHFGAIVCSVSDELISKGQNE